LHYKTKIKFIYILVFFFELIFRFFKSSADKRCGIVLPQQQPIVYFNFLLTRPPLSLQDSLTCSLQIQNSLKFLFVFNNYTTKKKGGGLIKSGDQAALDAKFQIQQEDFPALPKSQINNPKSNLFGQII
jgi:hypothetical protein